MADTNADPTRLDINIDPRHQRLAGGTHFGATFDVPYISNACGNLWQGGCATGLVLPEEIVHVVSLYPWERYTVRHQLRSQLSVVMYDSVEQGFAQVEAIARWVSACMNDGPTLVHCQAGLNRSGLVSAVTLVLRGSTPDEAIRMLRDRRSPAVLCNPAFEQHIRTLRPYLSEEAAAA
jgi:protein-tyrosine phosphatase